MSTFVAILMAVIQLVLPLFPAGELQVKGSLSANGIPAAYQATVNTESQTVEIDVRAILSTIFHMKADSDGILVEGQDGSVRYAADELMRDLNRALEHPTGKALSWEALRQYIGTGAFSEDIQAVLQWLACTKMALPFPETVESNGQPYYRVTLNPSQILAMVNNAIDSLTTPGKASQTLSEMKIWNVLGLEAAPNIRYLRYILSQMSGDPWQNSTYDWLFDTKLHLDIQWPAKPAPYHTAPIRFSFPSELRLTASFYDQGNPVVWDVCLTTSELSGSVHFGDLQTVAFSLVKKPDKLTLHADYCLYAEDHYVLTAEWSADASKPSLKARLIKSRRVNALESYITPLFTIESTADEIMFFARDEYASQQVQGSVYRLGNRYDLNIRISDLYSRAAEGYEIHAEADTAPQNGSFLSVLWSCDVFNGNLDKQAQFSGLLDCTFSESSAKQKSRTK